MEGRACAAFVFSADQTVPVLTPGAVFPQRDARGVFARCDCRIALFPPDAPMATGSIYVLTLSLRAMQRRPDGGKIS
jgi:hypothetical protein